MPSSIKIAPSNSILFISDPGGGRIPEITRERRIWSTTSCIAFGCLMFQDGETDVTLGNVREVSSGGPPAFDGILETPSRSIVVSTVEHTSVLGCAVSNTSTRVRIWTNHPTEPDEIIIGLG